MWHTPFLHPVRQGKRKKKSEWHIVTLGVKPVKTRNSYSD